MRPLKFALFAACIPLLAYAQSGEWGPRGNPQRFAVRGNLVFAADGRGVAVYDVSHPASIHQVAAAETSGESSDLAFVSDNDLAVATSEGIDRFDVAADGTLSAATTNSSEVASRIATDGTTIAGITPGAILAWDATTGALTSRISVSQPASAIAFHGTTLLAAFPGIGVVLYDLTGARPPVTLTENAQDIAVSGDVLSIAAGADGLVRYDLSGSMPALLDRTGAGAINFQTVAASGSRAFVTGPGNQIEVFDLTGGAPAAGATLTEPTEAIAASATSLFVSGMVDDRFGPAAFSGTPLRMFDTTNAASPQLAGEYVDLAGPVSAVATDGSLAYVVDVPFFRVIDISTTAQPHEIASLQLDGFGSRLRVKGNQAIVYGRGDVQLIDISNPYAPRLIQVFHSNGGPPSGAGFARDTIIEANGYSGFHVVDFQDFVQPQQIGGLKGHYSEIAADGDTAWAMYFATSLAAVDLSDPRNPHFGKIQTIGARRLEVAPATANRSEELMVLTADGVHLFSLAAPLDPVQTGVVAASSAAAVAADGDTGYVALPGLVESFDLLNPVPQPTDMHPIAPMAIAASGGKVVVADRYSLRVFGPNTAPPPPPPLQRRRAVDP